MILTITALLAAQGQAPPLPSHVPDFDFACIVWATLADEKGTGWSWLGDWSGLESWCGGIIGTPPSTIVEAELFLQGIDQDTPRDWTSNDILATFALLDTNGDGVIEIGEPTPAALAGESPVLARAFVHRTARLLLLETADADGDGRVTEAERASIDSEWRSARNRSWLGREWIARAKSHPVGRWSPISPGASLAAFGAGLDGERDGQRIDWLAMECWFGTRDMNHDCVLSAREIYAPVGAPCFPTLPSGQDPPLARLNATQDASAALRRGDVDGAVQRLIGCAWLSPESLDVPGPEGVSPMETARALLTIALPGEAQPLLSAFRLLGISLDET